MKWKGFKVWRRELLSKWENTPLPTRVGIMVFLNHGLTAIPISIFFYLIMTLFLDHSFVRWLGTMLCCWIFTMIYEHYFLWHKGGWKDVGKDLIEYEEEKNRQV